MRYIIILILLLLGCSKEDSISNFDYDTARLMAEKPERHSIADSTGYIEVTNTADNLIIYTYSKTPFEFFYYYVGTNPLLSYTYNDYEYQLSFDPKAGSKFDKTTIPLVNFLDRTIIIIPCIKFIGVDKLFKADTIKYILQ